MTNEFITTSNLFKGIQKLTPGLSQKLLIEMITNAHFICATAMANKKFDQQEIMFLKNYLHREYRFTGDTLKKLVQNFVIFSKEDQNEKQFLNSCLNHINENLGESKKIRILETLFCLSKSDDDIDKNEKRFLKTLSKKIGLSLRDYNEELITASYHTILNTKKDVIANKEYETQDEEFKIISLSESYSDFLNNFKKS